MIAAVRPFASTRTLLACLGLLVLATASGCASPGQAPAPGLVWRGQSGEFVARSVPGEEEGDTTLVVEAVRGEGVRQEIFRREGLRPLAWHPHATALLASPAYLPCAGEPFALVVVEPVVRVVMFGLPPYSEFVEIRAREGVAVFHDRLNRVRAEVRLDCLLTSMAPSSACVTVTATD